MGRWSTLIYRDDVANELTKPSSADDDLDLSGPIEFCGYRFVYRGYRSELEQRVELESKPA